MATQQKIDRYRTKAKQERKRKKHAREVNDKKLADSMTHSIGSTANKIRKHRDATRDTLDQMSIYAHNRSSKYDN